MKKLCAIVLVLALTSCATMQGTIVETFDTPSGPVTQTIHHEEKIRVPDYVWAIVGVLITSYVIYKMYKHYKQEQKCQKQNQPTNHKP